ncbi:hypothetical protein ACIBLA_05485 [Streptomyces sp. NPDC050433]|uniref:hypothetical protein n=1 Tax=unclassified Streptomyces TaxID=2593676 RepID=UPI00343E3942
METDQGQGPVGARGRSAEREGRLRTCLPARVTTREHEARDGGAEHQEALDQEWNVVRGED